MKCCCLLLHLGLYLQLSELSVVKFHEQAMCVAIQYAPLLPPGWPSTSSAADQTQRSSSFPMPNTFSWSLLHLPHALRPRWVKRPGDLDLLTLKVVSKSHVTWATYVPILVFLGLSVLDLGLMYATDRRQRKVSLNAPPIRGGSIIMKVMMTKFGRTTMIMECLKPVYCKMKMIIKNIIFKK